MGAEALLLTVKMWEVEGCLSVGARMISCGTADNQLLVQKITGQHCTKRHGGRLHAHYEMKEVHLEGLHGS